MQHPAVCRLRSFGQHQGLTYLAYEYVEGSSLAEVLAASGVHNQDKLPMMRSLVQGVAALHEPGICHLGLTPERIKVTDDNQPKILSLDRALLHDAAGESAKVDRRELRYMAPEQREIAIGDERTDVFRLCLVLFEVISRRSAIKPASIEETREQLKAFAPAPDALGTSPAAINLMTFLRKGLATDPEHRYANAMQMLAAMPNVRVTRKKPKAAAQTNSPEAAPATTGAAPENKRDNTEQAAPVRLKADNKTEIETQVSGITGDNKISPVATSTRENEDEKSNGDDGLDARSSNDEHGATPPTHEQHASQPAAGHGHGDSNSNSDSDSDSDKHGNSDSAQTLAYVLDRLATGKSFPVLSQSVFEINQLTSLQANTTVSQIADVILRDYALSNKLIKLANSACYGAPVEVTRVTDAIRLLGFEQVRITANGLAYAAKIGPGMEELRDAMLKSFASGLVARQLADDVKINGSEEAFLCAMFHDTGEHLTIHYMPEEYAKVLETRRSGQAQNKADAATEVFGLTFTAIEGKTADGEPLDDAQQLQLSWIARGANDLCELAGRYSPDEADAALQTLAERLNEHLFLDTKHLRHALHEAAEKTQALAPVLGIDTNSSDYMQALARWGPSPPADPDTQTVEQLGDDPQETPCRRVAS